MGLGSSKVEELSGHWVNIEVQVRQGQILFN